MRGAFEPVGVDYAAGMSRPKNTFAEILAEEQQASAQLKTAFAGLGYALQPQGGRR